MKSCKPPATSWPFSRKKWRRAISLNYINCNPYIIHLLFIIHHAVYRGKIGLFTSNSMCKKEMSLKQLMPTHNYFTEPTPKKDFGTTTPLASSSLRLTFIFPHKLDLLTCTRTSHTIKSLCGYWALYMGNISQIKYYSDKWKSNFHVSNGFRHSTMIVYLIPHRLWAIPGSRRLWVNRKMREWQSLAPRSQHWIVCMLSILQRSFLQPSLLFSFSSPDISYLVWVLRHPEQSAATSLLVISVFM